MIRKLEQHLSRNNLLPANASIIVAVSGGIDSVALLDLLATLQAGYGWKIAVAHLDHKVRLSSADDAQLVADLARKYDYKYYLGQLGGGETREAALRKARYDFLESIRAGAKADWIVTAHHRDDRIETSIFNAIRGADRQGLTAMKPVRGNLVRPLLPFRKGDLIAHAHAHKLPFMEDETNYDPHYSRNFVRHDLLPHAATYDTNFQVNYLSHLDRLEKLNHSIESSLEQVLYLLDAGSEAETIVLKREGLLRLPPLVQLNLLVHIGRQLCPGIGFSNRNLAEAQSFLPAARTGGRKLIAGVLMLERSYDKLILRPAQDTETSEGAKLVPLGMGAIHEFGNYNLAVNVPTTSQVFDEAWLKPQNLYVRTWQKGDRMYPVGLAKANRLGTMGPRSRYLAEQGSKKLSDIFIDRKVPRANRLTWPVVVNASNEIMWLPGIAVDSRFFADPSHHNYHVTCEVV